MSLRCAAGRHVDDDGRRTWGARLSILVVLELEAVDGKADEMKALLGKHLGDTRARKGCESVSVHQDQDRPNSIVLVERWATREDDDAYRAWRAGDGAIKEMGPLVAAAPIIRYFDDVEG
jgi:quinol monooxygenase YgiN